MSFLSGIFSRKRPLDLTTFTDWHCHLLPGVDDGVQSIEESLDILRAYEQAGIGEVWLTPHIMEDLPNTPSQLLQRFEELKVRYTGPIELNLAAENMIDSLFSERLAAGDLLPIGRNRRTLLVETSYFSAPMKFYETIDAIKSKGYYPLLAHPERYDYISGGMAQYKKLKDKGVKFQLNLMSLGGHYGQNVREKALKLLAAGMYDHVGSDVHSEGHFEALQSMKLSRALAEKVLPLFLNRC